MPGDVYVCEGDCNAEVMPSSKFHSHETELEESERLNVYGAHDVTGVVAIKLLVLPFTVMFAFFLNVSLHP